MWANAFCKQKIFNKSLSRQRRLYLRIVHGYRTLSVDTVAVLAGPPPYIDLLAKWMIARWKGGDREVGEEEMYREFQERWDATPKGRWTHCLKGRSSPGHGKEDQAWEAEL